MSGDEARDSRENFMTYGNSIILFMLSIDLITRPGFTLRGLLRFARYCAYLWKRVEAAPVGVALWVIVANRSGDHYFLPYPCSLTPAGWVNAATGISLALRRTHLQ